MPAPTKAPPVRREATKPISVVDGVNLSRKDWLETTIPSSALVQRVTCVRWGEFLTFGYNCQVIAIEEGPEGGEDANQELVDFWW
jgi:hypothetical protein